MNYKIQQIEGIGAQFGDRLAIAGILTSHDLLEKCSTADRRKEVAMHTGLAESLLTAWKNQAELMRISGIGPEYGQLLEASGIRSIRELSLLSPENVVLLLDRLNVDGRPLRTTPPIVTARKWIEQAVVMSSQSTPRTTDRPAVPEAYASLAQTMLHSAAASHRSVALAKS